MVIRAYRHTGSNERDCELHPAFEMQQSIKDESLTTCPACGAPVERLIDPDTGSQIIWRGTGGRDGWTRKGLQDDKAVEKKLNDGTAELDRSTVSESELGYDPGPGEGLLPMA